LADRPSENEMTNECKERNDEWSDLYPTVKKWSVFTGDQQFQSPTLYQC
jgi:hypothetical protein